MFAILNVAFFQFQRLVNTASLRVLDCMLPTKRQLCMLMRVEADTNENTSSKLAFHIKTFTVFYDGNILQNDNFFTIVNTIDCYNFLDFRCRQTCFANFEVTLRVLGYINGIAKTKAIVVLDRF